ncbi:hypothetical protein SPF06_00905 [Sinomonas sp. JGH33]|uniref:DNA (cytosine-5-)-methyltransferase n=1 Tax=Sinomonas terricola TaxID=3110330 RepID=A0ABU5T1A2_9MICC|nr:hypothetical protein [Sinomonas sp. JGH33]MEA5453269.1 hypothetical protein [Sinomonas sp. JGH33]
MLGTARCADGVKNNLRDPEAIGNPRGRLEDQIGLLVTPTSRMWKGAGPQGGPTQIRNKARGLIEAQVMDLLPTPSASVANDGEGVETWDARRERVKARGINGNGMGEPLTIAAQRLLPTPSANIGTNGGSQHPDKRRAGNHQPSIQDVAEHVLLPTPQAHDAQRGKSPEQIAAMRARGHGVANLNETIENGNWNANPTQAGPREDLQGMREAIHSAPLRKSTRGQDSLSIAGALQPIVCELETRDSGGQPQMAGASGHAAEVLHGVRGEVEAARPPQGPEPSEQFDRESGRAVRELPSETPLARGQIETNWGPYGPAIRRWEECLGRKAPAPIELNAKGNHRLSPAFCEFMMGVPEGWITDIPISRNEQLKACGNGVVPQQAAAALKDMLRSFDGCP